MYAFGAIEIDQRLQRQTVTAGRTGRIPKRSGRASRTQLRVGKTVNCDTPLTGGDGQNCEKSEAFTKGLNVGCVLSRTGAMRKPKAQSFGQALIGLSHTSSNEDSC